MLVHVCNPGSQETSVKTTKASMLHREWDSMMPAWSSGPRQRSSLYFSQVCPRQWVDALKKLCGLAFTCF